MNTPRDHLGHPEAGEQEPADREGDRGGVPQWSGDDEVSPSWILTMNLPQVKSLNMSAAHTQNQQLFLLQDENKKLVSERTELQTQVDRHPHKLMLN